MSWFPLHCHSDMSLLDGLGKPAQIASRLLECGTAGSALTDHGTVAGCPGFLEKLKGKGLKPILGCEFYVCDRDAAGRTPENRRLRHLVVLAKDPDGWRRLCRASSESARPELSYYKPRLDLERLAAHAGGRFVCLSGHMGSDLADRCFAEPRLAYGSRTEREARDLLAPDWQARVAESIRRHQKLFGPENFYVEIQLVDHQNLPASLVVAGCLREVARRLGVPRVATADSHYPRREDAADQRVLLCLGLDTTLPEVNRRLESEEDVGLAAFFRSNNYHVPSPEEMRELHSDHPEELACSLEIAARCESYGVSRPPMLPAFECPDGADQDSHFLRLCEEGWSRAAGPALAALPPDRREPARVAYRERLESEARSVREEGYVPYFLVVADYVRYAVDELKTRVGRGRGSGAGCMVSWLLGITRVDPVRHGLLFERFINVGRNSPAHVSFPESPFSLFEGGDFPAGALRGSRAAAVKGDPHFLAEMETLRHPRVASYYRHVAAEVELDRSNPRNSYFMWAAGKVDALDRSRGASVTPARVSMPDIDSDFGVAAREKVIEYCRNKYGRGRVCQMATYSRMQGRGALKDVLRVHERCPFEETNEITKHVPDESQIADQLREMEDPSIIRWALEHHADALANWCHLADDGSLQGPLAREFAQAIRLEGTRRNMGRHASGLVICPEDVADVAPMAFDPSTGEMITAIDYREAELMGLVKFDLLGLRTLDCLDGAMSLVRTGAFPGVAR